MDPLTALGLAAGVIQFVSFAAHLVSRTKEIHESATGKTKETATLESLYTKLQQMSLRLEESSKRDATLEIVEGSTDFVNHVFAINDLSRICEGDCRRLLNIVSKLKAGGDGAQRRIQTLRVALKTSWKSDEIAELEKRLHRTQTTITLHVCALTSFWHASFDRTLKQLRSENLELNSRQSAKLDDVSRILDDLSVRIATARSTSAPKLFDAHDITSIESQMSRLSLSKTAVAKEHLILRSLGFESRPARHSSIPEASIHTFEWAFSNVSLSKGPLDLRTGGLLEWISDGDGFFWVTGKPGSGKSTFMKHVADHPSTQTALSKWSQPKRTLVASHYFWSAGTPMQQSQQGLLQTLLYDIFRQLPDLIETVCTERWQKTIEELAHDPWLVPELERVLRRIAELQEMPAKFCFFIDGLDEFGADHVDLCASLHELGRSPHFKLCVSSRSWNLFEYSFGRNAEDTMLRIHEFTRKDIRSFAERRLQEHPRWKELTEEVADATSLIDQITERAEGVFLWVFLVTRELRSGLSEYDSYSDIKERLNSIPNDLEAFFKHILHSVESFYHQKMASTLQIALAATQPAPAAVYGFHDAEYDDEDYAHKLPLQPMNSAYTSSRLKEITRRLNGRCRGLLDVNGHSHRVEFLHRSVMDFLRTKNMSNFLESRAPSGSNAGLSVIRGYLAYIKTTRFPEFVDRTGFCQHTDSILMAAIFEVLSQARDLDGISAEKSYLLLDELDDCIPAMQASGQAQLNVWGNPSNPVRLFFREPLLAADLARYFKVILPKQPNYFEHFEKPALAYVIYSFPRGSASTFKIRQKFDMLRCLLENACDPNAVYYEPISTQYQIRTPWDDYIRLVKAHTSRDPASKEDPVFEQAIMKDLPCLMLQHGADPSLWAAEPTNLGCFVPDAPETPGLKKRSADLNDYTHQLELLSEAKRAKHSTPEKTES
ncbi:hypothetical protein Daus18300_012745 [Diaporthe australafricana]|uniref:NACHT domain-containing protein n=1 Tax=Diaporthe australafricana TaxID=127596 RepID=A0ABR3W1J3_9PEZI